MMVLLRGLDGCVMFDGEGWEVREDENNAIVTIS